MVSVIESLNLESVNYARTSLIMLLDYINDYNPKIIENLSEIEKYILIHAKMNFQVRDAKSYHHTPKLFQNNLPYRIYDVDTDVISELVNYIIDSFKLFFSHHGSFIHLYRDFLFLILDYIRDHQLMRL